MNWNAIETALEAKLRSLNLGMPIWSENVEYSNVPGQVYIAIEHYFVDSDKIATGVMETVGVTRFIINFPAGEGPGPAAALADIVSAAFAPGTSIPAGSGYVTMNKFSLGHKEPGVDPAWWALPLSVYYNAYHNS